MNIVQRKSKWWKLWKILFPNANMDGVFIAFGKTIFVPHMITQDLLVHESVHLQQHKYSYWRAFIWWVKYYFSLSFRYSQELEAYRAQYEFIVKNTEIKDRNRKVAYARTIRQAVAQTMALPMYGPMCTYEQALNDLR